MDKTLRIARTSLLALGMVMMLVHGAFAADKASPDDTARLLAGMPPSAQSPLAGFTRDASWQRHARTFDKAWQQLDKVQLERIRAWSGKHILRRQPVLYYMFSGPDYLYADTFFPDAATYVLSGLEPVGAIPDVAGLSNAALAGEVGRLQRSLNSVLSFSFFITKKMKTELKHGRLTGTLPILYVFLARSGKTVHEVSLVALDATGKLLDDGAPGTERAQAKGAKIVFSGKDGAKRTLYYFSTDISDGGFDKSGFLAFCSGLGRGDALLKSASYLMHSDNFSKVRDFVLDRSDVIVEDDSGIPLRFFKPDEWQLQAFGNYIRPLSIFPRAYQPGLKSLYVRSPAGPLDFGIGYHWRPRQSNLLLATRGGAKTADRR
jgi:hypothetical protein